MLKFSQLLPKTFNLCKTWRVHKFASCSIIVVQKHYLYQFDLLPYCWIIFFIHQLQISLLSMYTQWMHTCPVGFVWKQMWKYFQVIWSLPTVRWGTRQCKVYNDPSFQKICSTSVLLFCNYSEISNESVLKRFCTVTKQYFKDKMNNEGVNDQNEVWTKRARWPEPCKRGKKGK